MDSWSGYKVLDHTQRGILAVAFFGFSVGFSGFFVFLGLIEVHQIGVFVMVLCFSGVGGGLRG